MDIYGVIGFSFAMLAIGYAGSALSTVKKLEKRVKDLESASSKLDMPSWKKDFHQPIK